MKIHFPHHLRAPVCSCLELWALGCINNSMRMGNGSDVRIIFDLSQQCSVSFEDYEDREIMRLQLKTAGR